MSGQENYSFNMPRMPKLIHSLHLLNLISVCYKVFQISGKSGRITAYVHYSLRLHLNHCIKKNLIAQLTAPVRWTQIVENMVADGYTEFTEVGPGTVLQGLVSKVSREVKAESKSTLE